MNPLGKFRSVGLFGIAVIGVLGCGSSSLQLAYEKVAKELPEAERAAKEAGVITDPKDLLPNPPLSPDDNAWPEIEAAYNAINQKLHDTRGWVEKLQKQVLNTSPGSLVEASALQIPIKSEIEKVVLASRKPMVDFDRPYGKTELSAIVFPEYANYKTLIRLLSLHAVMLARSGQIDDSARMFEATIKLCGLLKSEPILIAGLVQVASNAITIRSMEYALAFSNGSLRLVDALEKMLAKRTNQVDLSHIMQGESVFSYSIASDPDQFSPKALETLFGYGAPGEDNDESLRKLVAKIRPTNVDVVILSNAYKVRCLKLFVELRTMLRSKSSTREKANNLVRITGQYVQADDPSNALLSVTLPDFEQVGNAVVKDEANFLCFESLLKVLKFKQANRRWPKTLAEAGAQATDPFDGKPMRYKITGNEVRIYTVGPDLVDDGGSETTGRTSENGNVQRDFASIYPRMPEVNNTDRMRIAR